MSNGFEVNSFQVPNAVVDKLMRDLSGSELKCYILLVRKTKGWHKEYDSISISQMMKFTGLSKSQVIRACASLVKFGLVDKITDGCKISSYSIKSAEIETSVKMTQEDELTSVKMTQVASVKMTHTKNILFKNNNTPLPPEGEQTKTSLVSENRKRVLIDYGSIAREFNEAVGNKLPNAEVINEKRKRAIRKLLSALKRPTAECARIYFDAFIEKAKPFYFGENDSGWKADFDYVLRIDTLTKVKEGSL